MTISDVVTLNATTFAIETATVCKVKTVVEVIEVKNVREMTYSILESALETVDYVKSDISDQTKYSYGYNLLYSEL